MATKRKKSKKNKGFGIEQFFSGPEKNKEKEEKQNKKVRRTFEISAEKDILLERIKLELKLKGKKKTKNELIEEAIELLAQKYGLNS